MISLFILACLAASSVSYPVRRQVPQSSSTLNNWWPFPPPPATVAPQLPDHITLVVPSPSTFSTDSESSSSPASTSSSSPASTSTSTSSSTSSSTPSSTPTLSLAIPKTNEDDSARRQEAHKHKLHKIIYFYIIPIFSFVGVICLSAGCWLLYGCCTRRPRYRSTSQGRRGRGYEKEWDCSSDDDDDRGGVEGFKAFRYEDFVPPENTNLNDTDTDDDDNYTAYTQPRTCQHTHEFGFECDCSHDQQPQRQSVVERELYRDWFKWPGINEGIKEAEEDEDEDGSTGNIRFSSSSNKKSPDMSLCSRTTIANTAISPTTALPTPTVVSPTTTTTSTTPSSPTNKTKTRSIGSTTRQTKPFESVQERLDREVVVPEKTVSVKKRGSAKSARSGKHECEEGFHMIVEEELERDEDEDGEEQDQPLVSNRTPVARQRGGSTHTSRQRGTTPISQDSFILVDGQMEYKKRNWLYKMVNSISRISSSSSSSEGGGSSTRSGRVGDRYTALPGSSETGVSMKMKFSSPTRSRGGTPHRQHRLPRISTTTLAVLSSSNSNLNSNPNLSLDPANADTTDYDRDLSQEIARQKERLAKHRESIASLPAGMVYSPPLVGVCVFDGGEDGRGRVYEERREERREKRLPPRPL